MKIGVLGTGMVGATIATKLIALENEVMLGSRTPGNEKAVAWARANGANASTGAYAQAARFGEILFNCTQGTASIEALQSAGAANSLALNLNLRFAVKERWTVSAGTAFFWRQSARDGIYGINVATLRTGQQSREREVGTLPSVRLDWRISRHLTYTAIYSHFFAGRFLKESPPGKDVDYVSTWLTFRF